jgi:hypothetical protein
VQQLLVVTEFGEREYLDLLHQLHSSDRSQKQKEKDVLVAAPRFTTIGCVKCWIVDLVINVGKTILR